MDHAHGAVRLGLMRSELLHAYWGGPPRTALRGPGLSAALYAAVKFTHQLLVTFRTWSFGQVEVEIEHFGSSSMRPIA